MKQYTGLLSSQPAYQARQKSSPISTGHHAGLHPEGVPNQTNDLERSSTRVQAPILYDDRVEPSRSNARRYSAVQKADPQTLVRITKHQGPPPISRASRQAGQIEARTDDVGAEPHRHARLSLAFLFFVLTLMLLGWILFSLVAHGIQVLSDNMHYGIPRTYQTDRDVGHGGVSHFTVENLQGHILIMEVLPSDPSHAKIYVGPVLSGSDADLAPATITFKDIDGNGTLEMILTVENTEHVYPNSPNGFQVTSNV